MNKSRLHDLLDLNEVPRWNSRVRLLRRQTVAEHTFNVMAIAYEIVCLLDLGSMAPTVDGKHRMMYRVLRWALVHDGPECDTGDVNYLFKRNLNRQEINALEIASCPWYAIESEECPSWARAIVKIADKIEEYYYISKWTFPDEGRKWIPGILAQIEDHARKAIAAYGWRNLPTIICGVMAIPIDSAVLAVSALEPQPQTGGKG